MLFGLQLCYSSFYLGLYMQKPDQITSIARVV